MFKGVTNINLDAKGRMAIPVKYRDEIKSVEDGQLVVTVDHGERCLVIYQIDKWAETEQAIMSLPNLSENVRKLKRLIQGYATDVSMDGQGRIMLSASQRDYAFLDKKVVLVGLGDRFEVWDEGRWKSGTEQWVADAPINIQNDDALKGLSI